AEAQIAGRNGSGGPIGEAAPGAVGGRRGAAAGGRFGRGPQVAFLLGRVQGEEALRRHGEDAGDLDVVEDGLVEDIAELGRGAGAAEVRKRDGLFRPACEQDSYVALLGLTRRQTG